jgi:predicted SAM-dependent methyltransferase
MKSQRLKDLYYASFAKLSLLSYLWHRTVHRGYGSIGGYLNIGCGPKYVEGMINIDGNIFQRKDLWLDVTVGLPFPDGCVSGIYASHILEHFDAHRAKKLLFEFCRVLKPGGAVRLIVPSLEYAIRAYQTGNAEKLPAWPDTSHSIGGRFNNFMLCRNQHRTMFDFTFLEELLMEAGFTKIFQERAHTSQHFSADHMRFESDPSLREISLYVEAFKE